MYTVGVEKNFCASHFLENYCGKCENLHGHNYKVLVTACGTELDETGMLMDFTVLKKHVNAIMDILDHKHLNEHELFQDFNATAENIAQVIYEYLDPKITDSRVSLKTVTVYETPTSYAIYEK